jgi:hypothetical protein
VPQRLKSLIALWFVLQIVLPFTAPLHTCGLPDLLGAGQHQKSDWPASAPLTSEANPVTNWFVSPLAASALRASTGLAVVCRAATCAPFMSAFDPTPSPQVQQTVLRL